MNTLWGALLALISALGWGTASVLVKIGMKNKSAVTVNIIRLYITAIFYACLFFFTGSYAEIFSLNWRVLLITFISGQFGFVIGLFHR